MDAEQLRKELRRQGHATMPPGLFDSCLSLTKAPWAYSAPNQD
jgi:hypothetical protein